MAVNRLNDKETTNESFAQEDFDRLNNSDDHEALKTRPDFWKIASVGPLLQTALPKSR